jgi:hypothetical protein
LSFKIYFDDIFAVRKTYETSLNTTVNADAYDLSAMLNRAWGTKVEDYTYSITKHTEYGTKTVQLVNNQGLTSSMVDLSALASNNGAYGSYEITYAIKGANADIPYQRVWIDVMDPEQKMYAHPDLHNISSARGLIWRFQDATATFKANSDGTMTYTTAGSWGAGLQIAPAYEQSYYSALQSEGYQLTFDLKLDVAYNAGATEAEKASPYQICTLGQGQNGVTYKNGETHTITIGLDKIVNYYKKLQNVGLGDNPDTDWFAEYVLFYVQYDKDAYAYNHSKLTFTISNFKMVK